MPSTLITMQHAVASRSALTSNGSQQTRQQRAIQQQKRNGPASTVVVVASEEAAAPSSSRRSAVLFAARFVASAAFLQAPQPARADRYTRTVCDPHEGGAECRANELMRDGAELGDYEAKSVRKVELAKTGSVPDLTNYQKETLALVTEIEAVLALDVYDMTREGRIKKLKLDGNNWSGRYAPGGAAKTASGRTAYNAINQISGHFTANGIAPLPPSRQEVVVGNLTKTRELIDQGR
mmetsp:Transcript_21403/g.53145  ORF Transcript_21403/g.53145 Transcript_21403/m.53145 type:complete len:237 (-) Transcript_21403:386-1096(-)